MRFPVVDARWTLFGVFVVALPLAAVMAVAARGNAAMGPAVAMQKKAGREEGRNQDPEIAIGNLFRGIQLDLESSSGQGFLAAIDAAKFPNYAEFDDMIRRLTSEDDLRVYFSESGGSIQEDRAQLTINASMELTRKDSAGQTGRRSQKLAIELALTRGTWKIVEIAPRDFFQPL